MATREAPQANRRRSGTSRSVCCSAMAATGGMRTARRAGLTAATTVTPTPTRSETTTVRVSKTGDPAGRLTPNPRSSASIPKAASTPRPMPTAEDTSPTIAASPRTERKTWRRLAPTMRRSASSRVRWPTMIEKVLKMVKAPTNSEMKANTNSAVEKKPSALSTALACSLATVCPDTTSTPCGRTRAIPRWTDAAFAPGASTTSMVSKRPTSPRTAWAVGTSKAATVAPARFLTVPKRAMPVMVKVLGAPVRRIRTRSPTLKPYLSAVPSSITTWLEVVGGRPSTIRSAEMRGSGS